MASWVVFISALVGGISVIGRSALQCVVVIWSLKSVKDERHRHAIELLKVLQKDRPMAGDRLRALTRNVPRPGNGSRDTDSGYCSRTEGRRGFMARIDEDELIERWHLTRRQPPVPNFG